MRWRPRLRPQTQWYFMARQDILNPFCLHTFKNDLDPIILEKLHFSYSQRVPKRFSLYWILPETHQVQPEICDPDMQLKGMNPSSVSTRSCQETFFSSLPSPLCPPCVDVWICCGFKLTQCENLPQKDPIRPYITQGGVEVMENAFWCHPFQRQEGLEGRILFKGVDWF